MSLKEKFAELKHVVGNALHYADPTALIEKATQALIESLVDTVHALQERVDVLEHKLADALAQIPSAEQAAAAATLVDANAVAAQAQPATAGTVDGNGAAGEPSAGSSTFAIGLSGDAPAVAGTTRRAIRWRGSRSRARWRGGSGRSRPSRGRRWKATIRS